MMKTLLTFLLTLALAVTLTPPLAALSQGASGAHAPQERGGPSGKIVDSYRRGDSGARPAWVDTALARSLKLLRSEASVHGLADADAELSFLSAVRDDMGQTHVRLEQVYKGVPVFGGQLIAHLDASDVSGQRPDFANGRVFKDARLVSTRARITAPAALAAVKKALGRSTGFERENVELVVLPEGIRRRRHSYVQGGAPY